LQKIKNKKSIVGFANQCFFFPTKKLGICFCLSRVNFTHFANFQQKKLSKFLRKNEKKEKKRKKP
jgi:hypothetical protein